MDSVQNIPEEPNPEWIKSQLQTEKVQFTFDDESTSVSTPVATIALFEEASQEGFSVNWNSRTAESHRFASYSLRFAIALLVLMVTSVWAASRGVLDLAPTLAFNLLAIAVVVFAVNMWLQFRDVS